MDAASSSPSPDPRGGLYSAPILLGETPEDVCPYLGDQQSALAFYKLILPAGSDLDAALERGMRRHGDLFYEPVCRACRECVPLRVPIESFLPSKSQRRLLRQSDGRFQVDVMTRCIRDEHVELFNRHAAMVSPTARTFTDEEYGEFLIRSDVDTRLVEYRIAPGAEHGDDPGNSNRQPGDLCGVSVLDVGSEAASSCYFFWDPDYHDWSLGTFSALWEIEWCRQHGHKHYYLGYWVQGCRSMTYKNRFRPHELLDWATGQWLPGSA